MVLFFFSTNLSTDLKVIAWTVRCKWHGKGGVVRISRVGARSRYGSNYFIPEYFVTASYAVSVI
jgi:hypothetical protein